MFSFRKIILRVNIAGIEFRKKTPKMFTFCKHFIGGDVL